MQLRRLLYVRLILRTMKLTAILLLCFCLQISANGLSQSVTLQAKALPLENVFNEVERQTGYAIVYNYDLLKKANPVTIGAQKEPVKSFFEKLLKDQPFAYSIRNTTITVSLKKLAPEKPAAQVKILAAPPVEISGKVTEENGNPLPGATITVLSGTQRVATTTTNASGNFVVQAPDENVTLEISFVGYVTKRITNPVSSGALSITLTPDAASMNDVVFIGYGSQRKIDMTGSVASVKEDVIRNRPINNLNQALVGQLAGGAVAQNDASPGGETSIKIRGLGSISGGNEPLYVIDGFPSTQAFANAILPNDIASVDVLKDASATAIYGSRGSNGVILITTKSGTRGTPSVSVNASHGFASVAKRDYYDLLTGPEYIQYAKELRNNQWEREAPGNSASDPNSARPPQFQIPDFLNTWNGVNTDWQDAIFESAAIRNYDVSVRGGSDNVRYFFSGGYTGDDGVLVGSNFEKFTARVKVDADLVNNKVKAGFNLAPSFTRQQVAKYNGTSIYESVIASALGMPPIVPVYNEDGSYGDRMYPIAGFLPIPNPVQLAREIQNMNRSFSSLMNTYLAWNITPGLELRTNFGATFIYNENDSYHPTTAPRFFAPPPARYLAADILTLRIRYRWV